MLSGRHRFSTCSRTFRIDGDGDRSRLTAESRAVLPGVAGRAYRLAVLRTGTHVDGVRGLLRSVSAAAPRRSPPPPGR